MGSNCWYQNIELGDLLIKRNPNNLRHSKSIDGVLRRRSKSTSSEAVDPSIHRKTTIRALNHYCSSDCSCSITTDGTDYNNLDGVFHLSGNLLARRRELLNSCKTTGKFNTKKRNRCIEIMNIVLLTSVFLLGAFSAVFLTICYKNGEFGGGGRTNMFQPFPREDQLRVTDEGYLTPPGYSHSDFEEEDNECDGENKLALELEAISSLHAALGMKEQGKLAKAQKLFQHAMALCPRHADVLTNYGEFFEEAKQDYMMADHLFVLALSYAPHHTKALTNRKRTLPVVEELDERRLKRIDSKREQLVQLSESNRALCRIRKEAYFQHIYHSAGIEGNTMTLSQTRMIVETQMAIGGKSIIEHNEILGLDAAMKFINSSLVNRIGKITVQDILLVHKHLMGYVDPSEAGRIRKTQVFVGNFIPPKPEEVTDQLNQLIEWLNSEEAMSLHPIHYAAIAHYKLVYIHPFLDGNGRTSRLLMNWVLMQANYPPVIIRKQDRHLYYEHLNTANKGDIRPFIRFIGDCTEKTMDVYLWATQEHYAILELEDEGGKEKESSFGI